jgi:hypothetical protein
MIDLKILTTGAKYRLQGRAEAMFKEMQLKARREADVKNPKTELAELIFLNDTALRENNMHRRFAKKAAEKPAEKPAEKESLDDGGSPNDE